MAEVWKGFDTQLHRDVAIKFLHPNLQNDSNFVGRFEHEAQAIAGLHHPNIVQIYDFHIMRPSESEQPLCYMVMDYIEGPTVASYLGRTSRIGRIPPNKDIIHLFTYVGKAVDYAHHKGMIHRDIKPSNILLDTWSTRTLPGREGSLLRQNSLGEPILMDFGLVKLLGTPSTTFSQMYLGT